MIKTNIVFQTIKNKLSEGYTTILAQGGSRSGKTFNILIYFFYLALTKKVDLAVARMYKKTCRTTVFKDLNDIAALMDIYPIVNKVDMKLTFSNGSTIECIGTEDAAKLRGFKAYGILCNEATEIPYEAICQLRQRMTGFMICDFNPTYGSDHWINIVKAEDTTYFFKTTYKDNPFLDKVTIKQIEAYKNTNPEKWQIYGLGECYQKEGLIYKFEEIDSIPDTELPVIIGLDFGFTHDPTAIIKVTLDTRKKIAYLQELCYKKGLYNSDIVEILRPYRYTTYADCAEPKSIADIKRNGIDIKPSIKGKNKLERIHSVRDWKFYLTKDSPHLLYEFRNYAWQENAAGVQVEKLPEVDDHLMDALSYAIYSYDSKPKGNYSISFH